MIGKIRGLDLGGEFASKEEWTRQRAEHSTDRRFSVDTRSDKQKELEKLVDKILSNYKVTVTPRYVSMQKNSVAPDFYEITFHGGRNNRTIKVFENNYIQIEGVKTKLTISVTQLVKDLYNKQKLGQTDKQIDKMLAYLK